MAMTDPQRRLLKAIQRRVPLVREPFAALADELGRDEYWVMDQIAAMSSSGGVIREISAIFDAVALGYQQTLVAMRVAPDRLDQAGRLVAAHPGVSHCYGRTGALNLWFTLATSPSSRLGLAKTVDTLARLTASAKTLLLPTLRRYKLNVRFDLENDPFAATAHLGAEASGPASLAVEPQPDEPSWTKVLLGEGGGDQQATLPTLNDRELRAVRALQRPLPPRSDPFARLAAAERLNPHTLLAIGSDFLADGSMRRYAAVLHHRAAGAKANVLAAWAVDEPAADAAGARCAQLAAVSHCYLRPARDDWPYSLYTMIHGRSEQDCRLTIDEIATTTGLSRRAELWTVAEYKKRRIGLFIGEEAKWEGQFEDED